MSIDNAQIFLNEVNYWAKIYQRTVFPKSVSELTQSEAVDMLDILDRVQGTMLYLGLEQDTETEEVTSRFVYLKATEDELRGLINALRPKEAQRTNA